MNASPGVHDGPHRPVPRVPRRVGVTLAEARARAAHRVGVECAEETLLEGERAGGHLRGVVGADAVLDGAAGARPQQVPLTQP